MDKFADSGSPYFINWGNRQTDTRQEVPLQSNENPSAIKLRQYLELRSRQLRLDLDAANLFQGKTETGTIAEDAIRRFLKASLPQRYSVGIGEVISTKGSINYQTQPKDVIIYDSTYNPIFGWGETGFHLFPIESVYAIIEVKKTIDTVKLHQGIKQAVEIKNLKDDPVKPFTAVIAFNSKTKTETLAENISKLTPYERVDFVLILNPKLNKDDLEKNSNQSDYIAHWFYHTPGIGGGPVELLTVHQAELKRNEIVRLTWARSEHTLMWFYLFLISSINVMKMTPPNLWEYTLSDKADLGYKGEFPFSPSLPAIWFS